VYLGKRFGLPEESIILFEQMRTIDKERLLERIGVVDDAAVIKKINEAIHISIGLP
jgi:mRNA interferase MazF